MNPSKRLLAASLLLATAGCATTSPDSWFFSSEPYGLELASSRLDVPELPASPRRELPPQYVDVPELRPLRGTLTLDFAASDLPLLAAPQRNVMPERREYPLVELPPSRGAPLLPSASLDVPTLPTPSRGDLAPASNDVPALAAQTRSIELGERYGPALDQPQACAPDFVFTSYSCRLPARSDVRERAWRNP